MQLGSQQAQGLPCSHRRPPTVFPVRTGGSAWLVPVTLASSRQSVCLTAPDPNISTLGSLCVFLAGSEREGTPLTWDDLSGPGFCLPALQVYSLFESTSESGIQALGSM